MVSGFLTSPLDQMFRIFSGGASRIRIASNVMGFAYRLSRIPHRSFVGRSSLRRLPNGRSVSIRSSFIGGNPPAPSNGDGRRPGACARDALPTTRA